MNGSDIHRPANFELFRDSRRKFLQQLTALSAAEALVTPNRILKAVAMLSRAGAGAVRLRDVATSRGLLFGSAASQKDLASEKAYAQLIAQQCGVLVPENELKMGPLRPTPDSFNFGPADWMYDFARSNSMRFRGTALVWHESLPKWFASEVNPQNARDVLVKHISTVVRHYAGKMHSWDVVNEVAPFPGNEINGMRPTPWMKLLGEQHIDIAFHTAQENDPNALLVYNETHLEYEDQVDEFRRNAALKLLNRWLARKVPVQAFGIQAHLRAGEKRFNPRKIHDFMNRVADLGLKIIITELDAADKDLDPDPNERDREIGRAYSDYLAVALENKAVIGVIIWGLSDKHTWLSRFQARPDGRPVRVLPFDESLQVKPVFTALATALEQAPPR